jgi:hypothetical protein
MNLRCIYCQTPFTLGRAEMLAAIMHMNEKGMNHYDAHCPRCRRANSISRDRMELNFPGWQEAAKQQAANPTPPPAPAPALAAMKTEPLPRGAKEAAKITRKPAATGKKPVAKSAAKTGKKTTAKAKPVAKKKAPAKGKKK